MTPVMYISIPNRDISKQTTPDPSIPDISINLVQAYIWQFQKRIYSKFSSRYKHELDISIQANDYALGVCI